MIASEFFKISYADDSYVAVSSEPDRVCLNKVRLEAIIIKHFNWLKSLGMIVNPLKTEYVVFQPVRLKEVFYDPLLVDSCTVGSFLLRT